MESADLNENIDSVLASAEGSKEHTRLLGNVTRKRRRPRTKALRCQLKDLLEKTILDKELRLPDDLFSALNDGVLVAPLPSVLTQLQQIFPNFAISKFEQLSPLALKSVSKITRVFCITDKLPSNSVNKNEEREGRLWLIVHPKQRFQREESTVYIDNLPINCTRSLLERRCKQFGTVVSISLPQISRIQRRIVQNENVSVQHSGFGFVQFASKTAARRFCKRYQLNSRLKRTHHHHGHRQKKAKIVSKQNLANLTIEEEVVINCSSDKAEEIEEKQFSTQTDEKTLDSSFIVPQIPSLTEISRSTRMRSQSVAESIISVDESGKETDQEEKPSGDIIEKGIKKHRRRRKPTTNRGNRVSSLNSLFRHIQAFPFKQYKKLRTNYLKLKKEKMSTIKKQIKEAKNVRNENIKLQNQENNLNEGNGVKKSKKRRRGIRKLMDAAELAKLEALKQF